MTDKPTISDVAEQHIQLHEHAMEVVASINANEANDNEAQTILIAAFGELCRKFESDADEIHANFISKIAASRASDKAAVEQLIGVPTVAQENG